MIDKPELKELVSNLVDKFDLQAISKDGLIDGDVLKDKLVEFIHNTTKESLDERKKKFAETLKPYVQTYGRQMCNDFYFFWTATKEKGWKMKWERESSWLLAQRLNTWKNNDTKYKAINIASKLTK